MMMVMHKPGCNYGVPGRGWTCTCDRLPTPTRTDLEVLADRQRVGRPNVVYVAHPVGSDVPGNIARTKRWLRWLIDKVPNVVWMCPWLPYLDVLDDKNLEDRTWAIQADCEIARHCDGIVLVGGRISEGMAAEVAAVQGHPVLVFDWTYLGDEPPEGGWRPR